MQPDFWDLAVTASSSAVRDGAAAAGFSLFVDEKESVNQALVGPLPVSELPAVKVAVRCVKSYTRPS